MIDKKTVHSVRVRKSLIDKLPPGLKFSTLVDYALKYYLSHTTRAGTPICIYVNNKRAEFFQEVGPTRGAIFTERSCQDLCGLYQRDPAALIQYLRTLDPELSLDNLICEQDLDSQDPEILEPGSCSPLLDLDKLVLVQDLEEREGGRVQGNLEGEEVLDV